MADKGKGKDTKRPPRQPSRWLVAQVDSSSAVLSDVREVRANTADLAAGDYITELRLNGEAELRVWPLRPSGDAVSFQLAMVPRAVQVPNVPAKAVPPPK